VNRIGRRVGRHSQRQFIQDARIERRLFNHQSRQMGAEPVGHPIYNARISRQRQISADSEYIRKISPEITQQGNNELRFKRKNILTVCSHTTRCIQVAAAS